MVVALDGSRAIRAPGTARRDDAAALGARVGAQLIADGAGDILAEAQRLEYELASDADVDERRTDER